jgi:non-ribosomal peptide synthetase component E (peptide arylation enzyme)
MEDLKSLTIGQVLERGAAQVPDKIAVVDGDQRKTYRELNAITDALAAALADIGLRKGDRAAIYMKNSFELMDEICIMADFPRLSGGVKIKKIGKGGLAEMARQDQNREKIRI